MDEETKVDREDAIRVVTQVLEHMPEDVTIQVNVHHVPLAYVSKDDNLNIVSEGRPGAFLTAQRDTGDNKVQLFLYVKR